MKKQIVWMTLLWLTLALPAWAQHPDHQAVVAAVVQQLKAAGTDITGACGAFAITDRVAWALRDEGLGILDKACCDNDGFNATHCEMPKGSGHFYSTDIVIYKDGDYADILGDAGGANTPYWGAQHDPSLIFRWRPPVDPGDGTQPPPVSQPVPPPVVTMPQPSPVVTQPPAASGSIFDYTPLLQQILDSQNQLLQSTSAILEVSKDTNKHVVNIDRTFGQTMASVGAFVGKYIAPAIGAFVIAKKTGS